MPFPLPTLSEFRKLIVDSFLGYIPEANLNRFADTFKRISAFVLGGTDNHEHIRQVGLDLFPDTAEGDFLTRHGTIWGVDKRGAVGSSGVLALKVTGTAAASIPVDEPLTHTPSGLGFKVTSLTTTVGADGFTLVNVAATSVGAQTNLEAGEELTFGTAPAGLDDDARIVVDLKDGLDEEIPAAHRARILNRIGQPAAGGNRNDWDQFVLDSEDSAATAYTYRHRNGRGTVDLAGLKSGTGLNRLLDAVERAALFVAIDPLRPVSSLHRMIEVTTLAVDVEITVIPESEERFAFDWDDSTPLVVSTYVALTRLLTFTTTRPPDILVGDRVTIGAATGTGSEEVIESLSGASAVVLRDDLSFTPANPDPVYSGGAIVDDARDAVITLFDSLGPANPDTENYGPWEGNLRLSKLFEVVQTSLGVLDSTIITPVANTVADDPAFPNSSTVELLIPGRVIIRKA